MESSYIGISPFCSGVTSSLNMSAPMTITKDNLILSVFIACDTGLTESAPQDWVLHSKKLCDYGTTYVYTHQPTGTTINPSWEISGLSSQLNSGYFLVFSGCTKNQNNVIDFIEAQGNNSGSTGGSFTSNINDMIVIRTITALEDVVFDSWDSTPLLTWEQIGSGSASNGYYKTTLGIAWAISHMGDYVTHFSSMPIIPMNTTIAMTLMKKPTNVVIMSVGN